MGLENRPRFFRAGGLGGAGVSDGPPILSGAGRGGGDAKKRRKGSDAKGTKLDLR